MSEAGKFLGHCAERYKYLKKLNGKQMCELFSKYDVWEYIYDCHEALCTFGDYCLAEDIDGYIEERKRESL